MSRYSHTASIRFDDNDTSRLSAIVAQQREIALGLDPIVRAAFQTLLFEHDGNVGNALAQVGSLEVYRSWTRLKVGVQHNMWQVISGALERDRNRLRAAFHPLLGGSRPTSHSLSSTLEIPSWILDTEFHLMPGGYARDEFELDTAAGALYEAGGRTYVQGQGIGPNDCKATVTIDWLFDQWPRLRPSRILEIGSGIGSATTVYAQRFPGAEVIGVDVGAGMVRFAFARACEIRASVSFMQMDCAALDFDDGEFDLVTAHNLFHEMPNDATGSALMEANRVLRPGGIFLLQDLSLPPATDGWNELQIDWQRRYNGERFLLDYFQRDWKTLLHIAGFDPRVAVLDQIKMNDGPLLWRVCACRKT